MANTQDDGHTPVEDPGQRWAGAGAWPTATNQGGWAVPSSGAILGGSGQKVNPSPKRPYGQVQRVAEDQWRCPDGKTFPRAYLAYRHLKELKEKNPTLLSPYKSPRTSTSERRALQQRAFAGAAHGNLDEHMMLNKLKRDELDSYQNAQSEEHKRCFVDLFGSRLDTNSITKDTSMYEMGRAWCLNDPNVKPTEDKCAAGEATVLPPPEPHTDASKASDYGKKEPPKAVDNLLQSTPDISPAVLLKMHKVYAQNIKNWWSTRRVHRINRFKKARINVILPNGINLGQEGEEEAMNLE